MKRTILLLLFLAATLVSTHAQWTNGQTADLVLGQPNLTSNTPDNGGVSTTSLDGSSGIAIDYINGKMYVADEDNNRVLRYAYPISSDQQAAELVFGQANFTSSSAATSQSRMRSPSGVAVDHTGRLWVSESDNHRIIHFDNAHTISSNGPNADGVLGQTNFTSNSTGTSQSKMSQPEGIAIDNAGRLWVADAVNSRILRFDDAANKTNGANADGVLGQPDFTSSSRTLSQSGMAFPYGVFITTDGTLWTAESRFRRVLRFDDAANKANGANADGVLGQANFTSNVATTSQSGMTSARNIAVDNNGRLYVTDDDNNRVLIFDDAANKANGANADNVLGQADFTSNNTGITASTMSLGTLSSLAVDNTNGFLWVSDTENNRVIRFKASTSLSPLPPVCSTISSPADAFTDIAIDATLSWMAVPTATGYKLKIGTSSGADDFLAETDLGNVLTYDPTTDFTKYTTYYVTLIPYNAGGDATGCTETTFTTVGVEFNWTNGQAADLVLGQPNLTSKIADNGGLSATSLDGPSGIAIDHINGKMYVVDEDNNRVLRYAYPISSNQQAAELVFGQADFTSSSPATSQSRMSEPTCVAVDHTGRLWVVDEENNRVLRFDNAHTITSNGSTADGVLGQTNFTSSSFATSQSRMGGPEGVSIDNAGTLWVADRGNNRILRFDDAANKTNGANADGVLGQADFTSSSAATSSSGMDFPFGVFITSDGTLWVAEVNNNRVLRFDDAANKANGANADGVLGKANFTSNAEATSQSEMKRPTNVAVDNNGRLYVTDVGNERVLIFDDAANKANGANADNVLGQVNFTSSGNGATASRMDLTVLASVAVDNVNGLIWLSDTNNNRGIRFSTSCNGASPLPTAAGMYQSTFSETDGNGWTHYCTACGELLLAVQKGSTGVDIADDAVELEIGATLVTYYPTGTGFINNPDGGVLMNRTWNVTATMQPSSDLPIRYFFTDEEYNAVNTELSNQSQIPLTTPEELSFYKTTADGNTPVADLTPTNTIVLTFGTASTTEWELGNHTDGDYYAEYKVASLSGGGGGGSSNGTVLPVELLSFKGQLIDEQVQLTWQTASEINNEGFYIERSENGKNWKPLAFVKGAGTTLEQQAYSFLDEQPLAGISYYRLQQVDFDGQYEYSNIISITQAQKSQALRVYPNPVQGGLLQVVIPSDATGQSLQVELHNSLGQVVALHRTKASKQLALDFSQLQSGIYTLIVAADGRRWAERVVVE